MCYDGANLWYVAQGVATSGGNIYYKIGTGAWSSPLGTGTNPAVVCQGGAGDIVIFVRGTNGDLYEKTTATNGATWSSWTAWHGTVAAGTGPVAVFVTLTEVNPLPPPTPSPFPPPPPPDTAHSPTPTPTAVYTTNLQTDVFYVNSANHHLLWDSQVNGIVTQMDLGGVVTATPAATTTSAGGIVVVVRGTGGVIYEMINEGNGFGPWIRVQNGLIGAGASLVNDPTTDNFYLFATGTNSQLYMAYSLDGGFTWSSWLNLGGVLHSAPSAAYATTHIVATVRGTDRGIWTDTGSAPYTATSDWHWSTTSIGGPP